jgi:hypothetical protein
VFVGCWLVIVVIFFNLITLVGTQKYIAVKQEKTKADISAAAITRTCSAAWNLDWKAISGENWFVFV